MPCFFVTNFFKSMEPGIYICTCHQSEHYDDYVELDCHKCANFAELADGRSE